MSNKPNFLVRILEGILAPLAWLWRRHERQVLGSCTGIEGREADRVSAETAGGVGELLAAAEKVLQYRGLITDYPPLFLYERTERIPEFALDRLAEAVKNVKSMLAVSTETGEEQLNQENKNAKNTL